MKINNKNNLALSKLEQKLMVVFSTFFGKCTKIFKKYHNIKKYQKIINECNQNQWCNTVTIFIKEYQISIIVPEINEYLIVKKVPEG